MNENVPDSHESQMHLDAMLYLLGDPAVDRDAFEARLLEDPQLSEVLAGAVDTFQSLKSVRLEWPQTASFTPSRTVTPVRGVMYQRILGLTIAASLFVACFVGWQTLVQVPNGSSETSLSASLNNVVLAWGDLLLDSQAEELATGQEVIDGEAASALNASESFPVSEVPDWLVLAAMELPDGQDTRDVKGFLQ